MADLTHFDESGASRMVDVAGKQVTLRTARASGRIKLEPSTLALVLDRRLAKGDVLEVARLAGIMAAKRTGELIPLCHPLGLDSVEIGLQPVEPDEIQIEAIVKVHGRTGVEMEALTAVSVAALHRLRHVQVGRPRNGDRAAFSLRKKPADAVEPFGDPNCRRSSRVRARKGGKWPNRKLPWEGIGCRCIPW